MRHVKKKLRLDRDTIRALATSQLSDARGGGTQFDTCSMCPGLAGCSPLRATDA